MPASQPPSSPVGHAGRIAAKVPLPVRLVALTAVALGLLRALRRRRR